MTNSEKITVLDIIEKKWIAVSLAVGLFLGGFAIGHAVGSHIEKTSADHTITASAATYNTGSTHAVIGLTNSAYDVVYTDIGIRSVTTNPNSYGQLLLMDNTGNLLAQPMNNPTNAEPFTIGGYTYNYGREISFYGTFTNIDGQSSPGIAVHALLYSQSIQFPEVSTDFTPEVLLYSGSNFRFTDYFSNGDLYVSATGSEYFGVTAYCYDYITTQVDSSGDPIHSRFLVVFPTLNVKGFITSTYVARSYQINYQPDIDGAYTQGYQAGVEFADGRLNVESSSYKSGFERGKIEGASSANDYSFNSLLYAIFDAPLKVIQEGLNFEILGVNIASFILAIVTLVIVVAVVKFLLR